MPSPPSHRRVQLKKSRPGTSLAPSQLSGPTIPSSAPSPPPRIPPLRLRPSGPKRIDHSNPSLSPSAPSQRLTISTSSPSPLSPPPTSSPPPVPQRALHPYPLLSSHSFTLPSSPHSSIQPPQRSRQPSPPRLYQSIHIFQQSSPSSGSRTNCFGANWVAWRMRERRGTGRGIFWSRFWGGSELIFLLGPRRASCGARRLVCFLILGFKIWILGARN